MEETHSPERKTYFTDVMLPVPIPKLFTYRVPSSLEEVLMEGMRVIVPFGKRKIVTGVIGHIHRNPPKEYEARSLLEILDDHPVMTRVQLRFLHWMSSYYMATIGEVLAAALPSGLKISSESRVQLNPYFDQDESFDLMSENETTFLDELKFRDTMTYAEVSEFTGLKNIYQLIHGLIRKDAILVFDEVKDKYTPKKQRRLRMESAWLSQLDDVFNEVSRAPRQEEALLAFLQHCPVHEDPECNTPGVSKKELIREGVSGSALKGLQEKGILQEFDKIISRFHSYKEELIKITLTEKQAQARDKILNQFESKQVVVLHGVTGSGKTAIYIDLIQQVLDTGSQVLYMLPEIALTTQIVDRLRQVFGDQLGVYHSKYSDNERVEVWRGVLSGRFRLVIGVRSSLFLPFEDLGLIIVDEEHEHSFKQYDPAPRYQARDAAIMLAGMHKARILLGSATPSLETSYLAGEGKYGKVTLPDRYGNAILPEILVVDMLREVKKKKNRLSYSGVLTEHIEKTISAGNQVIIFQNRRGYSPYLQCEQCGWIPNCTQCAVSLTYHQFGETLICHYCGYKEPVPSACEACGFTHLAPVGLGTERVEEETTLLFEDARILRMDLDTTRSKYGYEKILSAFEKREADILIGTQMVSKGLDFDHVSIVGIVDFDRMLHFPNFRSTERAFQMALQVSGRAGRKDIAGKVIIQTRDTKHPVLQHIENHDYNSFYKEELEERSIHGYPPFTRLIQIHLKHRDRDTVREAGRQLVNILNQGLGRQRVLGPQEPLINKVRNEYLVDILIKLERSGIDLKKAKGSMQRAASEIQQKKIFKQVKIVFDVDPY